jgi:autotransporter-associated beta strand protein
MNNKNKYFLFFFIFLNFLFAATDQKSLLDEIKNKKYIVYIENSFIVITNKFNLNPVKSHFADLQIFSLLSSNIIEDVDVDLSTDEPDFDPGNLKFSLHPKVNNDVRYLLDGNLLKKLIFSDVKGFNIEGRKEYSVSLIFGHQSINTYTGNTTLTNKAAIECQADNNLSPNSTIFLNGPSTKLNLNKKSQVIKALSGNGIVDLSGATLEVNGSEIETSNFIGYIKASSSGTLTKKGASTFNLLDNKYHKNQKNFSLRIEGGYFLIEGDDLVGNTIYIDGGHFGNLKEMIFPISKSISIQNNSGIITNRFDFTIDSLISGSGVLIKTGNSALTLTNISNSYSGGTKIDAGALTFSNKLQLGTGNITLNGGELHNTELITNLNKNILLENVSNNIINTEEFVRLTGNIEGLGGFIKKGIADLQLDLVANTFSGLMEVQGGFIAVNSQSNLGSGAITLNGGGLANLGAGSVYSKNITLGSSGGTIESDTSAAFSGIISGSGILFKDGAGVISFDNSAAHTYSGGTVINQGSIKLTIADAMPSAGNVNIRQGAKLDLNSLNQTLGALSGSGDLTLGLATLTLSPISMDSIYTGVISGTGSLVKTNTGDNTLAGDNVYSGTTTVNGGKLIINGSITSDATINASGTLKGNGTITGTTIVNGTVSPGNSVGTLNFVGDYTQANGSTLEVELGFSQGDLVNVTSGSISIDAGAALSIITDVNRFTVKNEYIIMQSDTSITGQFGTVSISDPSLLKLVQYNANSVVLLMQITGHFEDGQRFNPKRVAQYLDSNDPSLNEDLVQIYAALDDLSGKSLNIALNQLHPSKYKGVILSQENNNKLIFKTILNNLNEPYKIFCNNNKNAMFWSNFSYDGYNQKGKNYLIGFDSKTASATLGIDCYAKRFTIGPFISYSYSDIKWKKNGGDAKLNSIYFGVYNKYKNRSYYLNSVLLSSINFVKANRNIKYEFINKRAFTKHNIYDIAIDIENGFIITKNKLKLRPFLNTIYQFLYEDKFLEKKAPGANLRIKSSINNFLRFEIGSNLNTYFVTAKNTYIYPDIGVFYVYEKRFGGSSYLSQIDETFPYFTTYGIKPNPGRVAYNLGLSNKLFNSKLNMTLKYQAEYGKKYKDQNINLIIKYDF